MRTVEQASDKLAHIESELTSRRDLAIELQLVSTIGSSDRAEVMAQQFDVDSGLASQILEGHHQGQLAQLLDAFA